MTAREEDVSMQVLGVTAVALLGALAVALVALPLALLVWGASVLWPTALTVNSPWDLVWFALWTIVFSAVADLAVKALVRAFSLAGGRPLPSPDGRLDPVSPLGGAASFIGDLIAISCAFAAVPGITTHTPVVAIVLAAVSTLIGTVVETLLPDDGTPGRHRPERD